MKTRTARTRAAPDSSNAGFNWEPDRANFTAACMIAARAGSCR
jgi:hypothetical protein